MTEHDGAWTCITVCATFDITFENSISRGLSELVSSGIFISETSLISRSLPYPSFVLFIPLITTKKSSPPLLLLLHLAYLFVSSQQCHTDSSVLFLSLVLYNEFCLGRDILQFGLLLQGQEGVGGMNKRRKKDSMDKMAPVYHYSSRSTS